MKRILHALAALWPERQEYHNTWLPDARNGLLRHAVAVLRVEHAMEELVLCKEPKTQPANAPDADTGPQTNDEPNNRLNLTSRLAGRRITVPGTSELASLRDKADLRIRLFANLPLVPAQAKAFIGQRPLRIKANQRISESSKETYSAERKNLLNHGYSLVFAITILFMCLTAAQQVSAQEAEPADAVMADIKPLQIGDTIPEYLWRSQLEQWRADEILPVFLSLETARGKWIVLDFWNTYCGSCINAFPRMNTLQKQYADYLEILTVTNETAERLDKVMERRQHLAGILVESIVNDKILRQLFPHRTVPHLVLINEQGRVMDFPESRELTSDYIDRWLKGERQIKIGKEVDHGSAD